MINLRSLSLLSCLGIALTAPPGGYPLKRTQYWFTVPIDHFASNGNSPTFQIRYFVDAEYWDPQTGPIIFYAGNEGRAEGFWDNSGFMTDVMGPQLKGLLVLGEHRYFGDSFPYSQDKAFLPGYNQYLTVD